MNKKKSVGRPPLSKDERTVSKNFSVFPSHLAYLKRVGGENLSRGVRVVTDAHMESKRKTGGLHIMICQDCSFFKDERCVDDGFVDGKTGEDMCRYNPDAVPIEEFRDSAIPVDYSRGRKKLFKTEG